MAKRGALNFAEVNHEAMNRHAGKRIVALRSGVKLNVVNRYEVKRNAVTRDVVIRNVVNRVAVNCVGEIRSVVQHVAQQRHAVKLAAGIRSSVKRCAIQNARDDLASALDRRSELGPCRAFRLVRSLGYQHSRHAWTCRSSVKWLNR